MGLVMPELEVLLGTLMYLREDGWNIESVSPATGKGLTPIEEQRQVIKIVMETLEMPIPSENFFRSDGPDVIAHRGEEAWKFECKGMGTGKGSTLRNNFDRAVASVMSYYDKPGTRLGLALPPTYLRFGRKLPAALRRTTNLYVLLVENEKVSRLIEPGGSLDEAP